MVISIWSTDVLKHLYIWTFEHLYIFTLELVFIWTFENLKTIWCFRFSGIEAILLQGSIPRPLNLSSPFQLLNRYTEVNILLEDKQAPYNIKFCYSWLCRIFMGHHIRLCHVSAARHLSHPSSVIINDKNDFRRGQYFDSLLLMEHIDLVSKYC